MHLSLNDIENKLIMMLHKPPEEMSDKLYMFNNSTWKFILQLHNDYSGVYLCEETQECGFYINETNILDTIFCEDGPFITYESISDLIKYVSMAYYTRELSINFNRFNVEEKSKYTLPQDMILPDLCISKTCVS